MHPSLRKFLDELSISAWALLAAGIVVSLIVIAIGENPVAVGGALWSGAFGSERSLVNTLEYAVPLTLAGLAVAFAFRCGLFNIGVEGQLYVGAFAAAVCSWWTSTALARMGPVSQTASGVLIVGLAAGMLAAALWAGIAGVLKSYLGVHEVIATIMLNWIALFLVDYMVNLESIKAPGDIPQTAEIVGGWLPGVWEPAPGVTLRAGFLLAALLAGGVGYLLWKTRLGYEIRAVGFNPSAAEAAGISVKGRMLLAMLVSGAIAGLLGAEQVHGVHHRFILNFSPGYGYIGIAIALLGRNHPVGIVCAAFFFAALKGGALRMDALTNVPREMITVLQATIILFVAAAASMRRETRTE